MACKKKSKTSSYPCIGELNHYIQINSRTLNSATLQSSNYNLDFFPLISVFAKIETYTRVAQFDESDIERSATHDITIRYIPGMKISIENWITYKDEYYSILNTQNIDEADEFMILRCSKRGDTSKKVNAR